MSGKKQLIDSLCLKVKENNEHNEQLNKRIQQSALKVTKHKELLAWNVCRSHLRKFHGISTHEHSPLLDSLENMQGVSEGTLQKWNQIQDDVAALLKQDEDLHEETDYNKLWPLVLPILEEENETRMKIMRREHPEAFLNEDGEDAWDTPPWKKEKKTKTSP